MATKRPGRGLTALGIVVLVVGVAGAIAMIVTGTLRNQDAVETLARAPVGCDTTLDFAEPGEYLVFVETRGTLDDVRGDCEAPNSYELSELPDVDITVVDPDGDDVDVGRVGFETSYDARGFEGTSRFALDIDEAGDHVIRVESSDGDFAVAVGRDPTSGMALRIFSAAVLATLGLAIGATLIVVGRRTARVASPAGVAPSAVPAFTPVGQPYAPPTYAQPGGPVNYPGVAGQPPQPGAPAQQAAPGFPQPPTWAVPPTPQPPGAPPQPYQQQPPAAQPAQPQPSAYQPQPQQPPPSAYQPQPQQPPPSAYQPQPQQPQPAAYQPAPQPQPQQPQPTYDPTVPSGEQAPPAPAPPPPPAAPGADDEATVRRDDLPNIDGIARPD